MATLVKTPSGTWKAVVRKTGFPTATKTFRTKRDAEDWSRRTEDEMVRGVYIQRAPAERMTVADALKRYLAEVSPTKRPASAASDARHSKPLIQHLGKYSLAALTPEIIAKYRDDRLAGLDRKDAKGRPAPKPRSPNKKQGSFKAVTTAVAVKQDLVISAYKPNGGLEQRFAQRGATPESAWDFVQTHLKQLPVVKMRNGELEFVAERDPRILFDRMVAWFVRHSAPVPFSSQEFQDGLRSRFPDRDGMVFLSDQVAEYDKKRAQVAQAPQMDLFVSDERSAIDWLTDFLKRRPSTYQEVHPELTAQLGAGWKKHEAKPELMALLENNFLKYDGTGEVPSQIHSYLSTNHKDLRGLEKSDPRLIAKAKDRWYVPDPNKAQDLEKKREKALLKEFQVYQAFTGRRLKEFRLEVLRAGFKEAWGKKDYQTIIAVAKKIPDEALQEDEKLLLWYDQAMTRTEDGL